MATHPVVLSNPVLPGGKAPALTDEQCKELFQSRDKDWYDLHVQGKQVADEEMRAYLDFYRSREGTSFKIGIEQGSPSPIFPIFVVLIGVLPKNLRELIRRIQSSWTVVDASARIDSVTDSGHGAMRAWHQNDTKMLPKLTAPSVQHSIISDKYQDYIEANKQLPGAQKKKGIKQEYTGYVEYTLRSWRSAQGRMVYDYYNNRFFLTPGHYAAGDFTRNAFFLVQLD